MDVANEVFEIVSFTVIVLLVVIDWYTDQGNKADDIWVFWAILAFLGGQINFCKNLVFKQDI